MIEWDELSDQDSAMVSPLNQLGWTTLLYNALLKQGKNESDDKWIYIQDSALVEQAENLQ